VCTHYTTTLPTYNNTTTQQHNNTQQQNLANANDRVCWLSAVVIKVLFVTVSCLNRPLPIRLSRHSIYHSMPMRQLNVTFEDGEFEQLKDRKGERNWREAIIEEFDL